jgi:hypothetical protein
MGYVPTPEQVERGLTDRVPGVRAAWARRMDYVPTPEQIERGLTDKAVESSLCLGAANGLCSNARAGRAWFEG